MHSCLLVSIDLRNDIKVNTLDWARQGAATVVGHWSSAVGRRTSAKTLFHTESQSHRETPSGTSKSSRFWVVARVRPGKMTDLAVGLSHGFVQRPLLAMSHSFILNGARSCCCEGCGLCLDDVPQRLKPSRLSARTAALKRSATQNRGCPISHAFFAGEVGGFVPSQFRTLRSGTFALGPIVTACTLGSA